MIFKDLLTDYRLLDAGDGAKLEAWNNIIVERPDPLAIWPKYFPERWDQARAVYHRSDKGGGFWEYRQKVPDNWTCHFEDLKFKVALTNFKHTGLFPEQAANWAFIKEAIRRANKKDFQVLNLFAYTGAATMAASLAGASEVVHVDAAKGMVAWAKENMQLNKLQDHRIRFIVDDCLKFLKREIKRGRRYDGIIMDPPSYGRGPNNELFKFADQINELLKASKELLNDDASFLIVNAYTTGYSALVMENVLKYYFHDRPGKIIADELAIRIADTANFLPCGLTARWENVKNSL